MEMIKCIKSSRKYTIIYQFFLVFIPFIEFFLKYINIGK